jgi:hypothetical protein
MSGGCGGKFSVKQLVVNKNIVFKRKFVCHIIKKARLCAIKAARVSISEVLAHSMSFCLL